MFTFAGKGGLISQPLDFDQETTILAVQASHMCFQRSLGGTSPPKETLYRTKTTGLYPMRGERINGSSNQRTAGGNGKLRETLPEVSVSRIKGFRDGGNDINILP